MIQDDEQAEIIVWRVVGLHLQSDIAKDASWLRGSFAGYYTRQEQKLLKKAAEIVVRQIFDTAAKTPKRIAYRKKN